MTGIDGFLGPPSILLDARAMPAGAKSGDPAGTHADCDRSADFGGHLAGLASQDDKASSSASLGSPPNRGAPAAALPGFPPAGGIADVNRDGSSGLESVEPEAGSANARGRPGGETRDGGNLRPRFVIGLGGAPAMASDSSAAAVNPGTGEDAVAKRMPGFEGGASFAAGGNLPASQRGVINSAKNAHTRAIQNEAAVFMASPLAPGFPSVSIFPATNEAEDDVSARTATSANPAVAGAARVSTGVQISLTGLPSRFGAADVSILVSAGAPAAEQGHRLAASIEPPPGVEDRTLASDKLRKTVEPLKSDGVDFPGGHGSGSTASAPNRQTVFPPAGKPSLDPRTAQAGLVLAPGDVGGVISPIETARLAGGSAAEQDPAGPYPGRAPAPNGGHGSGFPASAPVGVLVLDRQTYLPPAGGLSLDARTAQSRPVPAPGPAPRSASGSIFPIETARLPRDSAVGEDLAGPYPDQTPAPNGGRGSDFAASLPVGISVPNQRTVSSPAGRLSLDAPTAQSKPVSVPGPVPGDAGGVVSPIEMTKLASGSAAAQDIPGPSAGQMPAPNGGHGSGFPASAPVGASAANRQTVFSPAGRRPLEPRTVQARLVPASGPAAGGVGGVVSPIETARLVGGSATVRETAEPQASHGLDPNGGHGSDFPVSAPVGILPPNRQTVFSPAGRLSLGPRTNQSRQQLLAPGPAPEDAVGSISPIEMAWLAGGSDAAQDFAGPDPGQTPAPNGGRGSELEALAVVKGLAVNHQVLFAPLSGLTPAQQIAKFVVARNDANKLDVSPAAAQVNGEPGIAGMAKTQQPVARVQTMELQLDPEILGKVSVKMRLAGSRLELRVETERPETMQLLGQEKDLLSGKLQAAGFAIDSLIIQTAGPGASQPFVTHANGQSQSSGQSSGQANGGPSAHDRPPTQDNRQQSRPGGADDAQDGAGPRRSGGDLYI